MDENDRWILLEICFWIIILVGIIYFVYLFVGLSFVFDTLGKIRPWFMERNREIQELMPLTK